MKIRARALLLALLGIVAPVSSEIIDRIAATIDGQVITMSEVQQLVVIRFLPRPASESIEEHRRRLLEQLIAQTLRYRDLERFGAEDVAPELVTARVAVIAARFESPEEFEEALRTAAMTMDDVRALVRRQLQVEAYIEERFSPLVFISLEEIEAYYRQVWLPERRAAGQPPAPLASVREQIRDTLKSERLEQEVREWTRQLRSRANVDVYVFR